MKTFKYTHSSTPLSYSDSDVVHRLYYDGQDKKLYVLLHSGTIAGYADVPREIYVDFKDAASKGRYWNSQVKNKYRGISGGHISYDQFVLNQKLPKEYRIKYTAVGEITIPAGNIEEALREFNKQSDKFNSVEIVGIVQE